MAESTDAEPSDREALARPIATARTDVLAPVPSGRERTATVSRYDLGEDELASLLGDEPAYRVRQVRAGLYEQLADPEALAVLPRALRARLGNEAALKPALKVLDERSADAGATTKWLIGLDDRRQIETVLMRYARSTTVCISSQAGCAMACPFCATGDGGFFRHLSKGEIVEQVVLAMRRARHEGRRVDHVVLMGMGEPLANRGQVFPALERIVGGLGIGARHVTVSTVGVLPGIAALANFPLQVNLAVSLHAARDELRDELVPLNRRYRLGELAETLAAYRANTRRRVSFEWAMIDGRNDTDRDAAELARYARPLGAHVNLIPLNPTVGGSARGLRGSPPARVRAFRDELVDRGVNVTVRRTRGREIDAACGQLAGSTSLGSPASTGGQGDPTTHP